MIDLSDIDGTTIAAVALACGLGFAFAVVLVQRAASYAVARALGW